MRYSRFLSRSLSVVTLWVVFSGNFTRAETVARTTLVPSETGVLLLPPLDTEPWSVNVLPQRQLVVRRRTQYEFISRQFKVLGETLAASAAGKSPVIDLMNVSARTAENMDQLAARTGASWVVSIVVEEVMEDSNGASDQFHGHCRVLLQIRDASQHRWLANGPYTGRDAAGSSSPVWLFMEAIDNATQGALASLLQHHPAIVPIAPVGQVADYLAGQAEPCVGDTKATFEGLGAK